MSKSWDLYELPVFVINMDRCPERLSTTTHNIRTAGFNINNIQRFRAVDGSDENMLATNWAHHGNPPFDPSKPEFSTYKGEQGCTLSHLNLWKHIITEQIPMAVVFEDDVFFHKDWATLSKQFMDMTPPSSDWDILFIGNQIEHEMAGDIIRVPVYCTHAYVITLDGAQRLYKHLLDRGAFPSGIYIIDCMLINSMWKMYKNKIGACTAGAGTAPFNWLVWNGLNYPDSRALECDPKWAIRNTGLVFQDPVFGTDIRPH